MADDIYDPGDGSYPHMPRNEDGTIDRSRIGPMTPMPHIRIGGVLTPLSTILDELDAQAST